MASKSLCCMVFTTPLTTPAFISRLAVVSEVRPNKQKDELAGVVSLQILPCDQHVQHTPILRRTIAQHVQRPARKRLRVQTIRVVFQHRNTSSCKLARQVVGCVWLMCARRWARMWRIQRTSCRSSGTWVLRIHTKSALLHISNCFGCVRDLSTDLSYNTHYPRASARIHTPVVFGPSVMSACGSTVWPGAGLMMNSRNIEANICDPSEIANLRPTQDLGPARHQTVQVWVCTMTLRRRTSSEGEI